MKVKSFVIAGTGQPELISLAQDCCDDNSTYRFLGFIDDNRDNQNRELYGYEILGGFDFLNDKPEIYVVNGIFRNSEVRRLSIDRLNSCGARFINLIHPTVLCNTRNMGIGNIIDRYTILHRGSEIGDHNMMLTSVVIGHDTVVGNSNFFGHKVVVNGHSEISNFCFFGAGVIVGPSVQIGSNSTIGMGAIVTSNIKPSSRLMARPPMLS